MKRKLFKILLIIVSTVVALLIILALVISPVAKSYIEKNSKELIGRKVQMRGLHINIFTGTLEVDSVFLYESNDNDVFASIDTFYINLELSALLGKNLEITRLKVINPYVGIIQNGDLFNFDDLMPKKDTTATDTSTSSFPESIVIKDIYFHGGKIVYTDRKLKNTINMNDLAVTIPELRFGTGDTKGGVHLKIGNTATIDSKLVMNSKTEDYQLNLKVRKIALNIIKPYMQEYYNISEMEGLLNADLLISGNMNHLMEFNINGTGDGTGFLMKNSSGEPLFAADSAWVKMDNISYSKSEYLFGFIHASNATLDFIMHPDPKPNNFIAMFKPEEPAKATTDTTASTPMTFKIKDLHVYNSQLNFTDNTMPSPYKLEVKKVDFQATNFDMNGNNDIKVTGNFENGGNIRLGWKGNMDDMANQRLMMNMKNFSLKLVSPYCKYYTAYDITAGNMNFVSKNNIRNNNIESSNSVDVFKMDVGKKHKEVKAEYNVPLKMALYIMKDKDDKINFDLPVKGNVKDPEFSYKKIIFKTIVNLLVKVTLAPAKFIAGTLGMNSDKLDNIPLDPLQTGFTAEQYSRINDLAEIVKKKPELQLELTQYANTDEVLPSFALYKTKQIYLKSLKTGDDTGPLKSEEIESMENTDPKFVSYLDSLVTVKGKNTKNISLLDKVVSLYVPDSLQNELLAKFQRRNAFLTSYMKTSLDIPEKNLNVRTAVMDSLKMYTGKPVYKIGMTLPGAENAN